MRPRIFTIPGLGFTSEVFAELDLHGPDAREDVQHLSWIEPLPKESLRDYATRMARPIRASPRPVALVGHSFGGVLAQEIAALRPVADVVLISSVKSRPEMPLWLRTAAMTGIYRLFSRRLTLGTFGLWGKHFGYATPAEQDLFRRMVSVQSDALLQWSLHRFSKWRGADCGAARVHHIHGDQDRTLPFRRIGKPVTRVDGGGHLMLVREADRISRLVRDVIEPRP